MTLVEIAVVLVILSVLAVIAVVGYRKYIRAGRMAEATNVVSMIMTAQHKHRSERGVYANVSTSAISYYPNPNPVGTQKTQWGGDCVGGACVSPRAWDELGVNPAAPVMFGYATTGGYGGQPEPPPVTFNGPAQIPTDKGGVPEPFFVITAALDYDNNGTPCQVTAVSGTNVLFVSNPDE